MNLGLRGKVGTFYGRLHAGVGTQLCVWSPHVPLGETIGYLYVYKIIICGFLSSKTVIWQFSFTTWRFAYCYVCTSNQTQHQCCTGTIFPVADPGVGGLGGLTPPRLFFFACQYMKIPVDLDPTPPPPTLKNSGLPPEEFLGPPLLSYIQTFRSHMIRVPHVPRPLT